MLFNPIIIMAALLGQFQKTTVTIFCSSLKCLKHRKIYVKRTITPPPPIPVFKVYLCLIGISEFQVINDNLTSWAPNSLCTETTDCVLHFLPVTWLITKGNERKKKEQNQVLVHHFACVCFWRVNEASSLLSIIYVTIAWWTLHTTVAHVSFYKIMCNSNHTPISNKYIKFYRLSKKKINK